MSGGFFDYSRYQVNSIADAIEKVIQSNHLATVNTYGDQVGHFFSDHTITEFNQAVILLRTATVYAQRIDWLLSGDDSEESFHTRLVEDLQKFKSAE